MTLASNFNFWAVAGLVYALAGAALFCNASFANPVPSPHSRGASADPERHALRRLGAQWLDSRVAAALLVVGFFLQLTGAVGTTTLNKPAVFVLLGLALFAGYYALAKDLLVEQLLSPAAPAPDKTAFVETVDETTSAGAAVSEAAPAALEYRPNGAAG
jgi:hypothetical protein